MRLFHTTGLSLVLLAGCAASEGAGDRGSGASDELHGYCPASLDDEPGAPGAERSLGWTCEDAPVAEPLYQASQLGLPESVSATPHSLAVDEEALYLSIESPNGGGGTFRLEKDGSRATRLTDTVFEELAPTHGQVYGVSRSASSGEIFRIDAGAPQQLSEVGEADVLKVSPDGRLYALQHACPGFWPSSTIAVFDPTLLSFTPVVTEACIDSFDVGATHLAWIEVDDDGRQRVHVSGIDGSGAREILIPPDDLVVYSVHVTTDYLYLQVKPDLLDAQVVRGLFDADLVRVPITGGEPECMAYVQTSSDAVEAGAFYSLSRPSDLRACLVRIDGTARALAQTELSTTGSDLVIDGDYAYVAPFTIGRTVVLRMPAH